VTEQHRSARILTKVYQEAGLEWAALLPLDSSK
jgi:hypothetical protein